MMHNTPYLMVVASQLPDRLEFLLPCMFPDVASDYRLAKGWSKGQSSQRNIHLSEVTYSTDAPV
jgi:hypothetical protein